MSGLVDSTISHDQVTRFLSQQDFTSKELWKVVKKTVREIETDEGVLIFDDTIQEKPHSLARLTYQANLFVNDIYNGSISAFSVK